MDFILRDRDVLGFREPTDRESLAAVSGARFLHTIREENGSAKAANVGGSC